MQIVAYPLRKEWQELLQRPAMEQLSLEKKVKKLLEKLKAGGDKAIKKMTKEFDGIKVKNLLVSEKEIQEAIALVPDELKEAIHIAKNNITAFHTLQLQQEQAVETMPGVKCWRRSVAIEKCGLYIPGGTAPLFSTVLMPVSYCLLHFAYCLQSYTHRICMCIKALCFCHCFYCFTDVNQSFFT